MPAQPSAKRPRTPRHYAIIGAGMAGVACARTLQQAGHRVTLLEQADAAGGRTRAVQSACGSHDAGAQYFTVRDARFAQALATTPGLCRPWSVSTVRVLDGAGRVVSAAPPPGEPHWVAEPAMDALVARWATALTGLRTYFGVSRLSRSRGQWQVHAPDGDIAGFDAVLLALPVPQAQALLQASGIQTAWSGALAQVRMAPCWTLMLGFAQAVRPGLTTLGPQWNAARSTHHRIAWLARESSKPGREQIERWTVQASPAWSREHAGDDEARAGAKLLKAFAEITGIRATPAWSRAVLWHEAQTTAPLGRPFLWERGSGLGACGDWCLGHRVEDAFVSGLELALAVL